MQRKTYALIDGNKLTNNIKNIIETYPNYKYYIGVVKNNAYHHGIKCVLDMISGGVNYFAVSSLEEALILRKYQTEYPILCLEPVSINFIDDVLNYDITITVESLDYLKELTKKDLFASLKIHLKIDSGMHRLGFQKSVEVEEAVQIINSSKHLILEGIYSHFATSGIVDPYWDKQVDNFLEITRNINLKDIPIVHFGRSQTLVTHPKLAYCNGIRLGIIMYGFSQSIKERTGIKSVLRKIKRQLLQKKYKCSKTILENPLKLNQVMSLYSEVMSIKKVIKGDVVGYNTYKIEKDGYVLTIPIGYADGVTKSFGYVFINDSKYPIISDSMDMIMVYAEDEISIGTKVEILGDNISISSVCRNLGINAYHLFNLISNRVPRVHIKEEEKEEIYY